MKIFFVLALAACAISLVKGYYRPAFIEDLRSRPDGRIVQGTPAVDGQFPHHAFIMTNSSTGGFSACGGSLITPGWVLTAAHCVQGLEAIIYLGHIAHENSTLIILTEDLMPHPDYDPWNLNNDLGLIALGDEVEMTANINIIPLAKDPNVTFAGMFATVSGFGMTSNAGPISDTLNYANVIVIANEICQEVYGSSVVISSTICAVGRDTSAQGTCSGDSGGPLMVRINGTNSLVGVVSFGSIGGCTSSHPNGFVRTSHHISWIRSWTGLE